MMKALTHNIQQEREDQRDRSAQLFMWCIVVSMHQDDGIGASRLLRACNEMDAFEKKYQTAILYGSSKNATDAMRENLKGICDFEVRLHDLTEWEDAEAAIRELHARGPEIERLYLDSKILPGELRALVMVSNCLEREFIHRQLATGQPLHMNVL